MQYPQPVSATQVMSFAIGAGRNEVGTLDGELVHGGMWPRQTGCGHGLRIVKSKQPVELDSQSARGLAHSKTLRELQAVSKYANASFVIRHLCFVINEIYIRNRSPRYNWRLMGSLIRK